MRKLMVVAILGLFGVAFLGCNEKASTTIATTLTSLTTSEQTGQTSSTTQAGDVCEIDPFDPSCITQDNIVLSYADWGDQNLNAALIEAFEAKYPNITVDLRQDITDSGAAFTGHLIDAQTAGILPDVFAIDNVPTGIYNGMLLDVSQYWDMDSETQYIYDNIADTAMYGDMRLAMPSFQFIKGIMINLTLLDAYNIDIPDKDWKYDDFIDLAIELRQTGKNDYIYGIDPWYGDLDFNAIFPTEDFEDVGYQTFDGSAFHFTDQSWIDAYNTKLSLYDQNVVVNFSEEELSVLGDVWGFYDGYVGFDIEGTWMLYLVDQMYKEKNFEVGFWPYPGGDAGQFPPTILDFICVSSQTEHPLEAYILAKWMTWGREGWLARLDAMDSINDASMANGDGFTYTFLDRYPIADFSDVWDRADFYIDYVEGLRENIELLQYAKPDVDKWLAGYKQFWEWVGNEENDYWNKINNRLVTPEVFAPIWEEKINEMIQEAMQQIIEDMQGA